MEPVIFLEKVRQPDRRGLLRRRLSETLVDDDAPPLTLLLAPAGSGKTTVLSHLASADAAPVAWYRAGADDAGEVALVRHLGHTLAAALGLPELVSSSTSGEVGPLVHALEALAHRPVRLVVDDVQEIAATEAERALERFLELCPHSVRVLLASRRPPALNIPRLLVSNELRQLDGNDLRFRSWEVEELFTLVHDRPLGPEAAAALTRRTGGWAAGLHLFHLATAHMGRAERERAVHALGGRTSVLRSYLTRNVLAGLPAQRLDFLVRTCTLGVLSAELCDDLLGTCGSGAVLAELEAQQLFTTSTDAGTTFRYHQVLQTHLELALVDQLGGDGSRALWARSASLLERAGHRAAAIHASARAEDWGAVARLLDPTGAQRVLPDETLWGALTLPGAPAEDPGLVLAGAHRLLRLGRVRASVDAFRQAEGLLDDSGFRQRCAQERTSAARWLPDLPPASDVSTAVLADLRRITRDERPRGAAGPGLLEVLMALADGDLERAAAALGTARIPDDADRWQVLVLGLAGVLINVLSRPGRSGPEAWEAVVLDAELDGWPWLARLGRILQAATSVALEPTAWRTAACAELLADLETDDDRWGLCLASLAMGYAWTFHSDPGSVRAAADRAHQLAAELGAPLLQRWAGALRAEAGRRRTPPAVAVASSAASATSRPAPGHQQPEQAMVGQLRCLGGFAVVRLGVDLHTGGLRPRARLLLMRLALQQSRALHREQLIDELWPEASLASGLRCLQVAVSSVRRCLASSGYGDDCLPRHAEGYALELPGVHDQVAEFEELAHRSSVVPDLVVHGGRGRSDALRAGLDALDAYTGDLLPEVGPAEWVLPERDRLRLLAATTAAGTARLALELDETGVGLSAAHRAVVLDPFCDSSWEVLIDLCVRVGDRSAAAVARQAQERVHAELGLECTALAAAPPVLGRSVETRSARSGRLVVRARDRGSAAGPSPRDRLSATTSTAR